MALFLIVFLLISSFVFQYSKDAVVLKTNKSKIDVLYISVVFLLFYIFLAFRDVSVGNDTVVYFDAYRNIADLSFKELLDYEGRFEIGYLFVNKVLSVFSDSPQFLLIVTGIFIIVSNVQLLYRYSKFLWLSVLLYFLLRYFDANMNIVRQAIALGFICYSYSFLRTRRFWLFTVNVLIASLFHFSAVIFWFAWFVTKIRFKRKYILLFFIGLLITYGLSSSVLELLFRYNIIYSYYLDSDYLEGGKIAPLLNLLLNLCIIAVGFVTQSYKYGCIVEDKGRLMYINDNNIMFVILLMAAFIQTIGLSFALMDRVAAYFQIFSVIFLPNSIKCIHDRRLYVIATTLVVIVAILYYWIIITYRPDWNRIYPYHFCF